MGLLIWIRLRSCCAMVPQAFRPALLQLEALGSPINSESEINVNLDGEPLVFKRFQVEVRKRLLPVRLGESELLSADQRG